MNKVTDEMPMAYADGELDPATAAEVDRAVSADPVLRDRLARFDETRTLTRAAYADVLDEPVPERLIAAAGAGETVDPEREQELIERDWQDGST